MEPAPRMQAAAVAAHRTHRNQRLQGWVVAMGVPPHRGYKGTVPMQT